MIMVEPYRITSNATITVCPIDDNTNRVFNAFRSSKRDPTHDSVLITKRNMNPKLCTAAALGANTLAANNALARAAGVRVGGLYRNPAGITFVRTA